MTKRVIPGTTDQWIKGIVFAAVLSFILPVLILAAPMLARAYVVAWQLVLGIDTSCPQGLTTACLLPPPSSRQDQRIPIPQRRGAP